MHQSSQGWISPATGNKAASLPVAAFHQDTGEATRGLYKRLGQKPMKTDQPKSEQALTTRAANPYEQSGAINLLEEVWPAGLAALKIA